MTTSSNSSVADQRITGTRPKTKRCAVRCVVSPSMCAVMKQNLLAKLTDPLERVKIRNVKVNNPHFFTRRSLTKMLKVVPRAKKYGSVFDKRAVDTITFYSYPYGYSRWTDEDEEMAELLCEL